MYQLVTTISVGITGHRWNKIPSGEVGRISEQLKLVFAAIDLAVQQSRRGGSKFHSPIVRLVSGLAEGADQMAIRSRPKGWAVDAILPFPRARYLEDFAPAHATGGIDRRLEFESALAQARSIVELPDQGDAVRGYQHLGEALLQESNLLVAVWDGDPAAGPGGTETVVTRALESGIPVVWICSRQDRAPQLLSPPTEAGDPPTKGLASADAIHKTIEKIFKTLTTASSSHPC